jgi:hypothetical protein
MPQIMKWNQFWPKTWGSKPETTQAQEARVRELVNAAPKLIPMFELCITLIIIQI